ncbi:MAG: AraC family transcriptional regulator [Lentisphaerales bacterium]|nr:AraC family transcriptional regulator [Lentisphaerales bacterium]
MIQAINLLGTNLSESMDMEALTDKLHMSYSTFRRKFKEQMNCSPVEYRCDIWKTHI